MLLLLVNVYEVFCSPTFVVLLYDPSCVYPSLALIPGKLTSHVRFVSIVVQLVCVDVILSTPVDVV